MISVEYRVLFTNQKIKKAKAWRDGILHIAGAGSTTILYDEEGSVIEKLTVCPDKVFEGETIETDWHLIQIYSLLVKENIPDKVLKAIASNSDNEISLLKTSRIDVVDRYSMKEAKLNLSVESYPNVSLPISAGLKRKSKGFVAPRVLSNDKKCGDGVRSTDLNAESSQNDRTTYKTSSVCSNLSKADYRSEFGFGSQNISSAGDYNSLNLSMESSENLQNDKFTTRKIPVPPNDDIFCYNLNDVSSNENVNMDSFRNTTSTNGGVSSVSTSKGSVKFNQPTLISTKRSKTELLNLIKLSSDSCKENKTSKTFVSPIAVSIGNSSCDKICDPNSNPVRLTGDIPVSRNIVRGCENKNFNGINLSKQQAYDNTGNIFSGVMAEVNCSSDCSDSLFAINLSTENDFKDKLSAGCDNEGNIVSNADGAIMVDCCSLNADKENFPFSVVPQRNGGNDLIETKPLVDSEYEVYKDEFRTNITEQKAQNSQNVTSNSSYSGCNIVDNSEMNEVSTESNLDMKDSVIGSRTNIIKVSDNKANGLNSDTTITTISHTAEVESKIYHSVDTSDNINHNLSNEMSCMSNQLCQNVNQSSFTKISEEDNTICDYGATHTTPAMKSQSECESLDESVSFDSQLNLLDENYDINYSPLLDNDLTASRSPLHECIEPKAHDILTGEGKRFDLIELVNDLKRESEINCENEIKENNVDESAMLASNIKTHVTDKVLNGKEDRLDYNIETNGENEMKESDSIKIAFTNDTKSQVLTSESDLFCCKEDFSSIIEDKELPNQSEYLGMVHEEVMNEDFGLNISVISVQNSADSPKFSSNTKNGKEGNCGKINENELSCATDKLYKENETHENITKCDKIDAATENKDNISDLNISSYGVVKSAESVPCFDSGLSSFLSQESADSDSQLCAALELYGKSDDSKSSEISNDDTMNKNDDATVPSFIEDADLPEADKLLYDGGIDCDETTDTVTVSKNLVKIDDSLSIAEERLNDAIEVASIDLFDQERSNKSNSSDVIKHRVDLFEVSDINLSVLADHLEDLDHSLNTHSSSSDCNKYSEKLKDCVNDENVYSFGIQQNDMTNEGIVNENEVKAIDTSVLSEVDSPLANEINLQPPSMMKCVLNQLAKNLSLSNETYISEEYKYPSVEKTASKSTNHLSNLMFSPESHTSSYVRQQFMKSNSGSRPDNSSLNQNDYFEKQSELKSKEAMSYRINNSNAHDVFVDNDLGNVTESSAISEPLNNHDNLKFYEASKRIISRVNNCENHYSNQKLLQDVTPSTESNYLCNNEYYDIKGANNLDYSAFNANTAAANDRSFQRFNSYSDCSEDECDFYEPGNRSKISSNPSWSVKTEVETCKKSTDGFNQFDPLIITTDNTLQVPAFKSSDPVEFSRTGLNCMSSFKVPHLDRNPSQLSNEYQHNTIDNTANLNSKAVSKWYQFTDHSFSEDKLMGKPLLSQNGIDKTPSAKLRARKYLGIDHLEPMVKKTRTENTSHNKYQREEKSYSSHYFPISKESSFSRFDSSDMFSTDLSNYDASSHCRTHNVKKSRESLYNTDIFCNELHSDTILSPLRSNSNSTWKHDRPVVFEDKFDSNLSPLQTISNSSGQHTRPVVFDDKFNRLSSQYFRGSRNELDSSVLHDSFDMNNQDLNRFDGMLSQTNSSHIDREAPFKINIETCHSNDVILEKYSCNSQRFSDTQKQSFSNCEKFSSTQKHHFSNHGSNLSSLKLGSQYSVCRASEREEELNNRDDGKKKFDDFLEEITGLGLLEEISADEVASVSSNTGGFRVPIRAGQSVVNIHDNNKNPFSLLVFPSKTDLHENPISSSRSVTIPMIFSDVPSYKEIFTRALIEHLNIQLYVLSKSYHRRLQDVDLSGYISNTSSSSEGFIKKPVSQNPMCEHNSATKLIQVKKPGKNQGRYFFSCSRGRGMQCKFFQWADTLTPGAPGRSRVVSIRDGKTLSQYFDSHSISLYCDYHFIRRSVQMLKAGNWNSRRLQCASEKKIYLKLSRTVKSSKYTKDDLWIVSKTNTFDPQSTFLARSTFYGPSAKMEVETLTSITPAVWPNYTACYALHAGNSSTEFSCLLNLKENVCSMSMPLLPYLLNNPSFNSDSSQCLNKTKDSLRSRDIFSLSLSETMSIAEEFIISYSLNIDQAEALRCVAEMMSYESSNPICLIHGVFGSGKSYLLSVIVMFIVRLFDVSHSVSLSRTADIHSVLVSSITNVAVDRVLTGLLQFGYDKFVRVGNTAKMERSILPYSYSKKTEEDSTSKEKKIKLNDVPVIGATCAACTFAYMKSLKFPLTAVMLSQLHPCFIERPSPQPSTRHQAALMTRRVVVLDECSQMSEPASLLPVAKFSCQRIILVGDPKQLDPTLQGSDAGESDGLEMSLFSRLLKMGYSATTLRTQYRCHPEISFLSNRLFYDNQLINGISSTDRPPLVPGWGAVRLFDVREGREEVCGDGGGSSLYNEGEVEFVVMLIEFLLSHQNISTQDIGVITLYRSQQIKISQALSNAGFCSHSELKSLKISTVDAFQGAERKVIILSCVRTRTAKFINCHKRTNVALTRACNHLLIVGNRQNLRTDSLWSNVVLYCEGLEGGVTCASEFKSAYKEDVKNCGDNKISDKKSEREGARGHSTAGRMFQQSALKNEEGYPVVSLDKKEDEFY